MTVSLSEAVAAARVHGMESAPMDGRQSENARAVQRGVGRLFARLGYAVVSELVLASGRRADMVALSAAGEIVVVEIKSSVADLRADRKWRDYRMHCDRLYFATLADVPLSVFPEEAGLILADSYGAEILRPAPEHRLAAATRKAVTLRFAHAGAMRYHALSDPGLYGL